mgnify:CR=1 FL=1
MDNNLEILIFYLSNHKVSLEKALMGKKVGYIVEINAPSEKYTVEILEIL